MGIFNIFKSTPTTKEIETSTSARKAPINRKYKDYGILKKKECISPPGDYYVNDECILTFDTGKRITFNPTDNLTYYEVVTYEGGRKTRRSPIKKRTRKAIKKTKKTHRRRKD